VSKRIHFPLWFACGLPVLLWVYTYVEKINSVFNGPEVYREHGLVENATNLFLLAAIVLFLVCLKKAELLWEKLWLLILAVGAIYFLGEEISWGYHLLGYDVNEEWMALNDQKEPNFHNLTGAWEIVFDKLPRQLLSVGVVLGGLLGVYADRRESWPNRPFLRRLIPPGDTLFVAAAANLVSLPERIGEHLFAEIPRWLVLGNASGELKECFLALFILLYAYGLFRSMSPSVENRKR